MKNGRTLIQKILGVVALTMCLLSAGAELCEGAGAAPTSDVAVAAPSARTESAPLFARADEESEVLMRYFSGAQLEVVAPAEDGMVRVRCGTVEGYMREGDLRFGAEAMRAVRPLVARLEFAQPLRIRTDWGDEAALTEDEVNNVEVWGMSGEWAQTTGRPVHLVGTWAGQELERGFLPVADGVVSTAFEEYDLATVLPLGDELTFEAAYERGIELALENPERLSRIPEERRTEDDLRAMRADLFLTYHFGSQQAVWYAYYEEAENIDINFAVTMDPYGELIEIQASNG